MRPDWLDDAACRGMDPAIFAPWQSGTPLSEMDPALAEGAKRVCENCPTKAECVADDPTDRHSVRGGLTPAERAGVRTDPTCPDCGRLFQSVRGLASHRKQAHGFTAQCGTASGYAAHRKRGEEACEACHDARRSYYGQRRNSVPRTIAACGTVSGYRRHRRLGEDACDECREANAAYMRRRRAS